MEIKLFLLNLISKESVISDDFRWLPDFLWAFASKINDKQIMLAKCRHFEILGKYFSKKFSPISYVDVCENDYLLFVKSANF